MTRSVLVALGLALLVAISACTNHRKSADAAAQAGQWKAAESHYRIALAKKPDDPELKAKHAEAKAKAFGQAMTTAKGCYDQKNWPCAQAEADYAAGLDPSNAEAKTLQANARREYALDDLVKARAGITGDPSWGLDMVDHARGLSQDAQVMSESARLTGELVTALLGQVSELRKQAAAAGPGALPIYDRAILMLTRGQRADAVRCGQALAEVNGEKARWIDSEYERLARLGDEGLIKNQWQVAHQSYASAVPLKQNGRANSAQQYARNMMDGDAAIARRDWKMAADIYRRSAGMPEDNMTRKFAANSLERVEVRPYRFRLASIFVNPLGPDGKPWAGPAVGARGGPAIPTAPLPAPSSRRGADFRAQVKGYSQRIPQAAKPNLVVNVTLPDGRVLRTVNRQDVWATYDGWFVIDSNQMDTRPLLIHVTHVDPKDGTVKDLGTVNVPLGSLVAGIEPAPTGPILWTEMLVDLPRTIADGAFGGFASVVPGRANEATDSSSPSSTAAVGWRLARVEAAVRGTDFVNEDNADGMPDLKIEVEQSGRVIYRSPEIKDSADGSWSPENVYVFAAPAEQLIVRLFDIDPAGGNDIVYSGSLKAPDARMSTVEVKTAQGSLARLVFERRVSTP